MYFVDPLSLLNEDLKDELDKDAEAPDHLTGLDVAPLGIHCAEVDDVPTMVIWKIRGNYVVSVNSAALLRDCQSLFKKELCLFLVPEVYAALIVTSRYTAMHTATGDYLRYLVQSTVQPGVSCPIALALTFIALLERRICFCMDGDVISDAGRLDLPGKYGVLETLPPVTECGQWAIQVSFDDLSGSAARFGTLVELATTFSKPSIYTE
ncbi:hypothetical protein N7499_003039 [Penicillium canescens]|uniref:Uncharacterized protein n=1 Tax=Penicillium canescens TaxID=5083 RepID=A0AAD6ICG3_PENCN|nr:uncharacterized protein N7446_011912 [Penicillium canescens]KAJ6019848.1 hypothetical protein N7522_000556 [Penicillium canescens]KAJ6039146.1 hypothetical protein N7460_007178 [Penicillium canescens]KAJ6047078.1 hypothetical protein N7446_011912 [Penicillium canescens]KAJ6059832.1 hypothetical protein N7444_003471 [Penicillium canescens]KAJ6093708.1 hypothetical protein N7499_003039 [Penicillium canescens]